MSLANHDITKLPWLNYTKPENRIILLKDNNKYVTGKTLQYGEKFSYKFEKKGVYTIRSGHYGEVQAEIIVR